MTENENNDGNVHDISGHSDYVEPEGEVEVAYGIHIVMTNTGQFGIQISGEPNTGEVVSALSRALETVRARMIAETVVQVQMAVNASDSSKRIITPRT